VIHVGNNGNIANIVATHGYKLEGREKRAVSSSRHAEGNKIFYPISTVWDR
jgi:hypothetical protein